jgi:hypothetical protein
MSELSASGSGLQVILLELPAIFIAGGAGLILGRGLLDPGTLPRREALAASGSRAIRLLLGVVPMLIIAGASRVYLTCGVAARAKFVIGGPCWALVLIWHVRAGALQQAPLPDLEVAVDEAARQLPRRGLEYERAVLTKTVQQDTAAVQRFLRGHHAKHL